MCTFMSHRGMDNILCMHMYLYMCMYMYVPRYTYAVHGVVMFKADDAWSVAQSCM